MVILSIWPILLVYLLKWRIYDWAIFSKTLKFEAKLWCRKFAANSWTCLGNRNCYCIPIDYDDNNEKVEEKEEEEKDEEKEEEEKDEEEEK